GERCSYHGWKFAYSGERVEHPFDDPHENFLDRSGSSAHKEPRLRGPILAYLGPGPAPRLPRWDVLGKRNGWRQLWLRGPLECNWRQIQENTADTIHTYYLHARTLRELGYPQG